MIRPWSRREHELAQESFWARSAEMLRGMEHPLPKPAMIEPGQRWRNGHCLNFKPRGEIVHRVVMFNGLCASFIDESDGIEMWASVAALLGEDDGWQYLGVADMERKGGPAHPRERASRA